MPDASQPRPSYRTGRKVGRTIYAQCGPEPSDRDQLIGLMDSPELAAFAVDAMNLAVRAEAKGLELAARNRAGRSAEDERDSLARRLAVRFNELREVRAALRQAMGEREAARAEVEHLTDQLSDLRAKLTAAENAADDIRAQVAEEIAAALEAHPDSHACTYGVDAAQIARSLREPHCGHEHHATGGACPGCGHDPAPEHRSATRHTTTGDDQ